MKLQEDADLLISDADFKSLVAEALDNNVLYCPRGSVGVETVFYDEGAHSWAIRFNTNNVPD